MLLFRAIVAFLVLPGMVAFAVPFAWIGSAHPQLHFMGLIPLISGTALLLWCVREFYISGRGTLAPWAPPQQLVVSGPYRYSRNPMYVSVALILFGWALLYWSKSLVVYLIGVLVAFHFRVLLAEEPAAIRRFGEDWKAYRDRTSRWLF